MAVTASGSAEQIAVSSLISYDVYFTYINKKADTNRMILVARSVILAYGCLSGVLAIILLKIGLSLGWVYLVSDILLYFTTRILQGKTKFWVDEGRWELERVV